MIEKPRSQVPAVYRRRVGDIVVTALSDGYADAGIEEIRNIDREDALKMFAARLRPARRAAINCFLVHSAGRVALIDTGCGPYFGPTAGRLLHNLSATGLAPDQIDTILLTHIHPDHSAGLTDLSNDSLVFPNAALVMHQDELEHWFDDARMAAAAEPGCDFFFRTGREQVEPYRDRWRPFQGTVEVFPGVNAMPLPGHTPGHTGYLVQSQGDRLLIWGDIIHIPEIQIARPEVTMTFDSDQTQAASTRSTLFENVASSALLVAGAHIDFPGFAHIVRRGTEFHLLPEPWTDILGEPQHD